MRPYLTLFFAFLVSTPTWAEYRVFLLEISSKQAGSEKPNLRRVKSNLDPEQYRTYFHLASNETITYKETWMCKGNTSGEIPYCNNPRAPSSRPDPAP